jgi:hypothetical protein
LSQLHTHMAKSLSNVRDALEQSLDDAFALVDDAPHKRLWQLLGNEAIRRSAFEHAIKAFVRIQDYKRIQFVKQVCSQTDVVARSCPCPRRVKFIGAN